MLNTPSRYPDIIRNLFRRCAGLSGLGAVLLTACSGTAHLSDGKDSPQSALPRKSVVTTKILPTTDPDVTFAQFHREKITSPIAYHTPPVSAFRDRPFKDTLSTSLEAADYIFALKKAGWFPLLGGDISLTILVPSNEAMEADARFADRTIFQPGHEAALRHALGETILIGTWDKPHIMAALKRHRATTLALRTIDHRFINVSMDAQTRQPVFIGAGGKALILWGDATEQTNGVFYIAKNLIDPVSPTPRAGRTMSQRAH